MSASYSSPGSFSGYRYSLTARGSSDKHTAWAELWGEEKERGRNAKVCQVKGEIRRKREDKDELRGRQTWEKRSTVARRVEVKRSVEDGKKEAACIINL